jgi:hypothetical protein
LGLGFCGSLLTDDEFDRLCENPVEADYKDEEYGYGVEFVSFTEDVSGKGWGTVVVRNLGEIGKRTGGKFSTLAEVQARFERVRSDETVRSEIAKALEKAGLSRLADRVDTMLYTDNY